MAPIDIREVSWVPFVVWHGIHYSLRITPVEVYFVGCRLMEYDVASGRRKRLRHTIHVDDSDPCIDTACQTAVLTSPIAADAHSILVGNGLRRGRCHAAKMVEAVVEASGVRVHAS